MAILIAAVGVTATAAAEPVVTDVPILGGVQAFAASVGVTPAPDAPRFIPEMVRLMYDVPEGKSDAVDAKVQQLVAHLELVRSFQELLVAAQSSDGTLILADARQRPRRDRLSKLLEFVGLRLREQRRMYSVERVSRKDAARRVKFLKSLGIDLDQLQSELNAGRAVRLQLPTERVPVALSSRFWSTAIFQHPVNDSELVAAILQDRNAALLARGLASLDDQTLEYLQAHPPMVTRLYEHDAAVFAAFGDALRIHNSAIVPPGGEPALELWENVVDERVRRPDRFVRELFSRNDGRLAYFYSTLDRLDADRQSFALGLWIRDVGIRADRFKALVDVASTGLGEWQLKARPFGRASDDLAMLLSNVRVQPGGAPVQPRARGFWARVFDSTSLDTPRSVKGLQEDGDIDAAWLATTVLSGDVQDRQPRFEQFTFAQRVIAGVSEAHLADALVTSRAYARFPSLLLALDRMEVREPATFVAAARAADRLSGLDANHAFVALSQFQSGVALLVRLVRIGELAPMQAEALLNALSALRVDDDGWYRRGVAKWMRGPLADALSLHAASIDDELLAALAGFTMTANVPAQIVTVEGHRYRVSLADAEHNRLLRFREQTGRQSLDSVFALDAVAEALGANNVTAATVQDCIRRLKSLSVPAAQKTMPPGVDPPKPPSEIVARAVRELTRITKPKDLKKTATVANDLSPVIDAWLGDVLRSLVYSLSLGDPKDQLGADVSGRHDFGFALPGHENRNQTPWVVPQQRFDPGVPFHLRGSLLNLTVATAPLMLTHVSKEQAGGESVLPENERTAFTISAALLDAMSLRDVELGAIADAIGRGRERIRQLRTERAVSQLDAVRELLHLDGWRYRAVLWAVSHDGDALSFFSLGELMQLGGLPAGVSVQGWGPAAWRTDLCLCSELNIPNRWMILAGRPGLGLTATQMPDLTLHVALLLHDRSLPASLTRDVLLAATTDFIDEVKPTDDDDWLTLVRTAQSWPTSRIDDYIAALSAGGPLLPVDAAGQAAH